MNVTMLSANKMIDLIDLMQMQKLCLSKIWNSCDDGRFKTYFLFQEWQSASQRQDVNLIARNQNINFIEKATPTGWVFSLADRALMNRNICIIITTHVNFTMRLSLMILSVCFTITVKVSKVIWLRVNSHIPRIKASPTNERLISKYSRSRAYNNRRLISMYQICYWYSDQIIAHRL